MTDQIAELEARLHEKDELVGALTQRLEQAAEQLDRMQRTGGDRTSRGGGGVPLEMLEEQRTLTQELQTAVTQWEDSQPSETLERIESRLTELREMIQSGGAVTISGGGTAPSPGSESEGDAGLSGYEALKASMFSNEPGPASTENAAKEPSQESGESPEADAGTSYQPQEELSEPDPVDVPTAIDFSDVDVDGLKDAVESRDRYIAYLIQKVRVAQSRAGLSVNWEALNNAPEELQSRLESLESRLEDTLRLTEVELSLERARLGREANRLEQLNQQIEKERNTLGIPADGASASEDESASSDDPVVGSDDGEEEEDVQGNRWLRMLGR